MKLRKVHSQLSGEKVLLDNGAIVESPALPDDYIVITDDEKQTLEID